MAKLPSVENVIKRMLREPTTGNLVWGRVTPAWKRNSVRNFESEPRIVITSDGRYVSVTYSIYHFLCDHLEITPESERMNKQFKNYVKRNGDGWHYFDLMELFAKEYMTDTYDSIVDGNVHYTFNNETVLERDIQYCMFTYDNTVYVVLQIHTGVDARAGFTDPRVFKVTDYEYFLLDMVDVTIDIGDKRYYTDDAGNHWYCDEDRTFDGDLTKLLETGEPYYIW